ncbi:MAG TPA: porin family protein [Pirellulaceae bacterium]|nr:porin family protein [Pirellulaceae bacterium]
MRASRWLLVVAALACGSTMTCAQEKLPANPLRSYAIEPAEIFDPQVQAALAIQELPSPEETIGVAWDEEITSGQPPGLLSVDPMASAPPGPALTTVPPAAMPRIGFGPVQGGPGIDEWPAIEEGPPPGMHYSHDGLATWRRWQRPWLSHSDPNDPHRHVGLGQPLEGTSWRNRPWFAGAFFGGAFHGDLTGNVRQNNGSLMGLRLGWDLDHYYGIEARYAFSNPQIMDGAGNSLGDSHDYLMDVSALYYPLGDARWRPYLGLGVGMATYRFRDENDERIHDSAVSVPISVGIKYFYSPHFTLRLDAVDNITFGSDNLDAMNHFFLLGSVEYRFGGRRPSYFPWHGGTAW